MKWQALSISLCLLPLLFVLFHLALVPSSTPAIFAPAWRWAPRSYLLLLPAISLSTSFYLLAEIALALRPKITGTNVPSLLGLSAICSSHFSASVCLPACPRFVFTCVTAQFLFPSFWRVALDGVARTQVRTFVCALECMWVQRRIYLILSLKRVLIDD